MSTPKNHHFIPKIYLKAFANHQQQLFQLVKGHPNISPKTISQICYHLDYFKLSSLNGDLLDKINDLNHIEKNTFSIQENGYAKLLKKLTHPASNYFFVDRMDVEKFLETLITFKRRGPLYREEMIKWQKDYVNSEQFKRLVETGLKAVEGSEEFDLQELFENFVQDQTTNPETQSDMYLKGFLDKDNTTAKDVTKLLMNFKIFIFHAPFGSQFLTSDNPGFTQLMNNQLLSFGGYKLPFRFFYPLTPKQCLYIDHIEHDDHYSSSKVIYIQQLSTDSVDLINQNTCKIAMNKIFSYNREILSSFVQKR